MIIEVGFILNLFSRMKELRRRREGREGQTGGLKDLMPSVSYYQNVYQTTTKRKYSYIWDSVDEQTLNDICLGKGRSTSAQDLPEVILVVHEETSAQWKNINHVSTL
jgi:hypothetical protein